MTFEIGFKKPHLGGSFTCFMNSIEPKSKLLYREFWKSA